jgi:FlaA1/EpsC-like NDP-sugar epimerase
MHKIFRAILAISRPAKRVILVAIDSILVIGALCISFSLSLDDVYWFQRDVAKPVLFLILLAPMIALITFSRFGLYRTIIRHLGMRSIWSIIKAVAIYAVLWGLAFFISDARSVPGSVVLINAMLAMLAVGGLRMVARSLLLKIEKFVREDDGGTVRFAHGFHQSRVVIFGAGAAGRQLAVGLGQSGQFHLKAFVDDNIDLQGLDLMGVPILSQDKLKEFIDIQKVDDIFIAIPSITRQQRGVIIERLLPLNVRIRALPGLIDLARGKAMYKNLHDLDVDDLLARTPAKPDETMLQEQVSGKTILVTGAGGSIGSELCRQILRREPKVLLLLELSEFALYTLHNELSDSISFLADEQHNSGTTSLLPTIIPLLGSVTDENRITDIVVAWKPEIIYHAAAVKHVPIVEQNIAECVKTNVLGTLVMAKVAIEKQVKCFVLVSTDKAVNPTNAMGASKRCCEMVLQALAHEESPSFGDMLGDNVSDKVDLNTQFSIVRFGNVLGSSGSVVPYFREQIAKGGPITLTHKDIIRYFMTIPEAAQLVMQTASMSCGIRKESIINQLDNSGADIYVLDMGEPVKIYSLARRMIELSGFRVKDANSIDGDIAIEVVGLRPGEKLYEELLIGRNPQPTQHLRIIKASEKYLPWSELQSFLYTLRDAATNGDVLLIRSIFKEIVPEYIPEAIIADWVYKEQVNKR